MIKSNLSPSKSRTTTNSEQPSPLSDKVDYFNHPATIKSNPGNENEAQINQGLPGYSNEGKLGNYANSEFIF